MTAQQVEHEYGMTEPAVSHTPRYGVEITPYVEELEALTDALEGFFLLDGKVTAIGLPGNNTHTTRQEYTISDYLVCKRQAHREFRLNPHLALLRTKQLLDSKLLSKKENEELTAGLATKADLDQARSIFQSKTTDVLVEELLTEDRQVYDRIRTARVASNEPPDFFDETSPCSRTDATYRLANLFLTSLGGSSDHVSLPSVDQVNQLIEKLKSFTSEDITTLTTNLHFLVDLESIADVLTVSLHDFEVQNKTLDSARVLK